jgi:hypothetical protein
MKLQDTNHLIGGDRQKFMKIITLRPRHFVKLNLSSGKKKPTTIATEQRNVPRSNLPDTSINHNVITHFVYQRTTNVRKWMKNASRTKTPEYYNEVVEALNRHTKPRYSLSNSTWIQKIVESAFMKISITQFSCPVTINFLNDPITQQDGQPIGSLIKALMKIRRSSEQCINRKRNSVKLRLNSDFENSQIVRIINTAARIFKDMFILAQKNPKQSCHCLLRFIMNAIISILTGSNATINEARSEELEKL